MDWQRVRLVFVGVRAKLVAFTAESLKPSDATSIELFQQIAAGRKFWMAGQ
jgi:hypothetical protein